MRQGSRCHALSHACHAGLQTGGIHLIDQMAARVTHGGGHVARGFAGHAAEIRECVTAGIDIERTYRGARNELRRLHADRCPSEIGSSLDRDLN